MDQMKTLGKLGKLGNFFHLINCIYQVFKTYSQTSHENGDRLNAVLLRLETGQRYTSVTYIQRCTLGSRQRNTAHRHHLTAERHPDGKARSVTVFIRRRHGLPRNSHRN